MRLSLSHSLSLCASVITSACTMNKYRLASIVDIASHLHISFCSVFVFSHCAYRIFWRFSTCNVCAFKSNPFTSAFSIKPSSRSASHLAKDLLYIWLYIGKIQWDRDGVEDVGRRVGLMYNKHNNHKLSSIYISPLNLFVSIGKNCVRCVCACAFVKRNQCKLARSRLWDVLDHSIFSLSPFSIV